MNNLLYTLDAIGVPVPVQEPESSSGALPWIIAVLVIGIAAAAFFIIRRKNK